MNVIEEVFFNNILAIFGGNVFLLALFTATILIVVLALFQMPGIITIPMGTFAFLLITSQAYTALAEINVFIILAAGFIVAYLVMKVWG